MVDSDGKTRETVCRNNTCIVLVIISVLYLASDIYYGVVDSSKKVGDVIGVRGVFSEYFSRSDRMWKIYIFL